MRFHLKMHTILICRAFSSKTHPFEKALENGSKYIVLVWMVKKGQKRIKMKAMKENIAGVCLQHAHRVQPYDTTCNSTVFEHFSGQTKTYQNSRVDINPLMHFQ